jgi:hypothetical protein
VTDRRIRGSRDRILTESVEDSWSLADSGPNAWLTSSCMLGSELGRPFSSILGVELGPSLVDMDLKVLGDAEKYLGSSLECNSWLDAWSSAR